MIIEKIDQVKDDNGWSSLPTLLLWMIKARLDYHNSVRFSLVCKHWKHAVQSYPPHFMDEVEVDNSPPWIMSYKRRITDTRREFVSLLTEECYTIDNPAFCSSDVLYSKQGWLLMVRLKHKKSKRFSDFVNTKYDSPYFLLNPFKNKAIELPFLDVKLQGAFTIDDGNPHTVVLARCDNGSRSTIVLYTTHPGDNAWLCYSHTCMVREMKFDSVFLQEVFIIRNSVYFMTEKVGVVTFNITNKQWMEVKGRGRIHNNIQFIVEKGGEILRLHFPGGFNGGCTKDLSTAFCYKLTIGEKTWWKYIDRSVFPTCFWFLSMKFGRSFVFEANEVHDLVKLEKTFRKVSTFCGNGKSDLVHMC